MDEMTEGQRIAAGVYSSTEHLGRVIDEAIRAAREEGRTEGRLSGKRAMQELIRANSELQQQLAAKEADCAAIRRYCVHIGDCPARRLEVDDRRCTCGLMTALASNAGADLPARLRAAESYLNNLLAVIHRDGGQYVAQHGLAKAVEDALFLSANRIDAEEKAAALDWLDTQRYKTLVLNGHAVDTNAGLLTAIQAARAKEQS